MQWPSPCDEAESLVHLLERQQALHQQFRAVLDDAIDTLERTKHAFRSRELGELRKRLQHTQRALLEPDASSQI